MGGFGVEKVHGERGQTKKKATLPGFEPGIP